MKPITQDRPREIIEDFARAISERKTQTAKPALTVINFRDEKVNNKERHIETVPVGLLRYRKDNGRIASDVMDYEKLNGTLDEKDAGAQEALRGFLKRKHPEMDEILIKSIEHVGQSEPAIVTCDGFLINGNRRKMALEHLAERHPNRQEFGFMKVVILPGRGESGGPPTLLEIEKLENRYQLQSEGKSEYYNFDRALSIKRKVELGFSLEDQLRDDPRYANAPDPELRKAVKQYEREFIAPLQCVDRYLKQLGRDEMYRTISTGLTDKEGRWQAFLDYSHAYSSRLQNQQWRLEAGVQEEDIGEIEQAAFALIRLRTLKGLPKVHQIMREIPRVCSVRESRKHLLSIADDVDPSIPEREQFDDAGNPLSHEDVDKKWALKNQQKLIMLTKKALDHLEMSKERETPLTLLETALKKLTNENFDLIIENLGIAQYTEASRLARDIQKAAKDIEHELYEKKKNLQDLTRKK